MTFRRLLRNLRRAADLKGADGMRVLVTGGRDFDDRELLYRTLDDLRRERVIAAVIQGGAKGADALASNWADERHIDVLTFRADWKKYGKAAGPMRNEQMLDEGEPGLVVAFPGGLGTADMVKQARRAGVEVIVVEPS